MAIARDEPKLCRMNLLGASAEAQKCGEMREKGEMRGHNTHYPSRATRTYCWLKMVGATGIEPVTPAV